MDEQNFLNQLLEYYDISLEEYEFLTRDISIADLPNPQDFDGMKEALKVVLEAMKKKDKIIVYGDYDADGVMSTSIIVKAFMHLDYKVNYYIPSRYLDGYGINLQKAKEIVAKGYNLLITVDNGISALEALEYCRAHGMKIIVIDHHEKGETLPTVEAIIHPQFSKFPSLKTSAGFVSFMFATALLGRYDKYLMTLGAISIVTDMMPLKGYNRDILRYTFKNFQFGEFKNLDLMSEGNDFDETTIGMKIGPKINAVGRVIKNTNINRLVTYFTSNDQEVISELYTWIESVNEERKAKSKIAIDGLEAFDESDDAIIALVDCDEGLIGIVANKILNEYHKPVVVFTKDMTNPGILKGSCRSLEGFNIVKAFEGVEQFTITSGGHELAGGLTIAQKDLEGFSARFKEIAKKHPPYVISRETILLILIDVNFVNYEIVQTLAPFGEEWKSPLFLLERLKTSSFTFSKTGEHIMTSLSFNTKLVGFNISKTMLIDRPYVDLTGRMNLHSYKGSQTLQFKVEEILPNIEV